MKAGDRIRVVDPGAYSVCDEADGLAEGDQGHIIGVWRTETDVVYQCRFTGRYRGAGYFLQGDQIALYGQMGLGDEAS